MMRLPAPAAAFSDGDFGDGCNEYRDLRAAVRYYDEHGRAPEDD